MPHKRIVRTVLQAIGCLACVASLADAQVLTGSLFGTVKDESGGVLPDASVQVTSPALIGGPAVTTVNEKGQFRHLDLAPGVYTLVVERAGFARYREDDVRIGVGDRIERTVILAVAPLAESIAVEGGRGGTQRAVESLLARAARGHSGSPLQHVRLHQGGARCVAHVSDERPEQQRVGVRIGRQRERVPP